MKRSAALAVMVLATGLGLGAVNANAQGSKGSGMMMDSGMMGGDCPIMDRVSRKVRGMMGADMQAMSDQRIAALKTQLAITPEQLATWDSYAAALKKNVIGMQTMHQAMQPALAGKNPVERLDARVAAMETRLAALKEVKPALSNLYTALSDEQKKKAGSRIGCMM